MNSVNNSRRLLNGDRGSSSVLVILIMVTLIVLGLIALMSTFSELKLARKNAQWVKTYYAIDSRGEILLSGIDSCLKNADKSAAAYISDRLYERTESSVLPSNLQTAVHAGWQKAKAADGEDEYIHSLGTKLYYLFSLKNFKASGDMNLKVTCKPDFENEGIYTDALPIPENGAVKVSATIEEETGADGGSLLIGISVNSANAGGPEAAELYEITSWKELPKEFSYKDSLDFKDLGVEQQNDVH